MPTIPPPAIEIQQEKEGWGSPPRWNRQDGWRARRSFRVFSADPEAVMLAPNLPAAMAAHSVAFPNIFCVSRVPEHLGGSAWRVNFDYENVLLSSFGSDPPPPEAPPETTYCDFDGVQETFTMYSEVNDAGAVQYNDEKINGSDGMPAYTGRDEIKVTRYYAAGQNPDLNYFSSLNSFPKAVNSDALLLPKIRGGTLRHSIAAKKLLYMGYKPGVTQNGIIVVTHTLWFAQDHRFYDSITTPAGTVLEVRQRQRYRAAAFAPLWPQT
jgi:hypothetical protein